MSRRGSLRVTSCRVISCHRITPPAHSSTRPRYIGFMRTPHSTISRIVTRCLAVSTLSVAALGVHTRAHAQVSALDAKAQAIDAMLEAKPLTLDAPIRAVTIYRTDAMVTRSCALPAEIGVFEIRIEGLPHDMQEETLAARITGVDGASGGKLLDVRFESKVTPTDSATNPQLREAIAALDAAQRRAELLALHMNKLADQTALLNAIAQKTATESAKDFGSQSLAPEALAKQIAFLESARESIITQSVKLDAESRSNSADLAALTAQVKSLGGKSTQERWAIVSVGKSTAAPGTLSLNYLVSSASWSPEYAIRASDTGDDATDSLVVEFNASIQQVTGEDWNNCAITLSTAEPTRRPAPPEITPEFLDVIEVRELSESLARRDPARKSDMSFKDEWSDASGSRGRDRGAEQLGDMVGDMTGGLVGSPGEDGPAYFGIELEKNFADAEAHGGAVVNYPLARKITMPSDSKRARTHRIATIELKPEFSHVVRPMVDPTVYLRAKARNTSAFQLIAGTARLFVGEDSVGATECPTIAPGAEITFWLGGDARLECTRTLVAQDGKESGIFGKEKVTQWKWRIDVTSSAQGSTRLDVADRMPVSRNEQIKIELKELSLPLSTDEKFLKNDRPRGILLWSFDMPGVGKDGKPSEKSIMWSVRQAHPVGLSFTSTAH